MADCVAYQCVLWESIPVLHVTQYVIHVVYRDKANLPIAPLPVNAIIRIAMCMVQIMVVGLVFGVAVHTIVIIISAGKDHIGAPQVFAEALLPVLMDATNVLRIVTRSREAIPYSTANVRQVRLHYPVKMA